MIHSTAKMVFLFDGIFYNLYYDGDRINARHGRRTQTNILFFDGHADTYLTAGLPGKLGPNPVGTDLFNSQVLGASPTPCWRLDQR